MTSPTTMKEAFTKGPWTCWYLPASSDDQQEAHFALQSRRDMNVISEQEANARLIAAAPDMYEALLLIEKSLNGQTGPVAATIRGWCADAIAKVVQP